MSTPMHCTPSLSRRLPMRLHCSVTTVKNLRRFPMRCHCLCQGCRAAKLKEIASAPILLSCHSCWGGCCSLAIAVLPLPLSRIWGDRWRIAIVIVKKITPPNRRRLLTHQHHSLATVVEEVSSSQSCCRQEFEENKRYVGGIANNQSNRQIFGTNRRGSQIRN